MLISKSTRSAGKIWIGIINSTDSSIHEAQKHITLPRITFIMEMRAIIIQNKEDFSQYSI